MVAPKRWPFARDVSGQSAHRSQPFAAVVLDPDQRSLARTEYIEDVRPIEHFDVADDFGDDIENHHAALDSNRNIAVRSIVSPFSSWSAPDVERRAEVVADTRRAPRFSAI